MKKNAICIIPARSGSKRLPNKNILKINKKPMLAHVIDNVKKSNCFKDIFVSTDSNSIKKIAERHGAKVPFMRSKKLSNDHTTVHEVIHDSLKKISLKYNYEIVCYIFPTSIFIKKNYIKNLFKKFNHGTCDYLMVVRKFDHPIERSLIINKNKIKPNHKKKFYQRTQDFKESFYDSGEIYFGKKNSFLKKRKIFNSKVMTIISKKRFIDIDTNEDFQRAKKLFFKK